MAATVLQSIASFHATGYHFLQKYKNGVKGFKKDHPIFFDISGWTAPSDQPRTILLMEKAMESMSRRTIGLLKSYGGGEDLIAKMQNFLSRQNSVWSDCHVVKDDFKFQTIIHNDLHMNNVMYK